MFDFKRFNIDDSHSAMKVGTDGVLLGAWAGIGFEPGRVLDAGAGSGLVSLMLAQRFSEARIVAVEIDAASAADARDNVLRSDWSSRIEIVVGDVLELEDGNFDFIVSNPPFFTESIKSPDKARAFSRHESSFGIRPLILLASRLLSPGGRLSFIAPASRDGEIDFLLASQRLYPRRRVGVRQRPDRPVVRSLWEASTVDGPLEISSLTIKGQDGDYTGAYRSLTKDFYLKF